MAKASDKGISGFVPAPIPLNESERMAALRAYDILDSAEEEIYNSITQAAAEVCQTSMASLTFIDENRQWFKSRVGLDSRETPRDVSFCAHAIHESVPLLVPDVLLDHRFRRNPFVTGAPHLRFYAGVPLRTESGLALGTLCVLDTSPKVLDESQLRSLEALAASAMRVLELRKNLGIGVFAKAVALTSDGVTIADGSMTMMFANQSFLKLSGFRYVDIIDRPPTFPLDSDCIQVKEAFEAAKTGQMKSADCRLRRRDGTSLWIRVSFVPYVDEKNGLRYLVSVYRDISTAKEADAQAQHLYAMRTTMATIAHVMKNFLNSAQLYSAQVTSQYPVDGSLQQSFTAAMENTRAQLTAIDRMSRFKERPTPFGVSMLDTDEDAP